MLVRLPIGITRVTTVWWWMRAASAAICESVSSKTPAGAAWKAGCTGETAWQLVQRSCTILRTASKSALPAPALTNEARPTAPIKTPAMVASVQEEVDTSSEIFRWPVRGRIISDFGAKPGGGKNEGVNLAVPEGTPVKSADDGTVIYSGNELKGYGNLILLRHSDGWVSAYAHNSELKVKRGDKIRRGDVVGLAGATGSVSQPQVHFELRRANKPVDPLKHLPQR